MAVTQRKIARNEIGEWIFPLAAVPITKQTNFVVLVCTSEIRPTKPKLGASASCRWVNERTDIFCDEFSKAAFPNYWLLIPLQSDGGTVRYTAQESLLKERERSEKNVPFCFFHKRSASHRAASSAASSFILFNCKTLVRLHLHLHLYLYLHVTL